MSLTLREWTAFGLSFFLSLVLLATNEHRQVQILRAAALSVSGVAGEAISAVAEVVSLRHKVDELMAENARLVLENARYRDAALENRRLRALLGFKKRSKFDITPAKVIARSLGGAVRSVTINVGRDDGVVKNAPVVTSRGLVGRVYLVGRGYSVVHLLIDRNFRAAALVERSRVNGILRWSGGEYCLLDDVPARADVQIGDLVVTSGLGGIYPPGLRLGVVVQVAEDVTSIFKMIYVKPAVDFSRLEEVAVLRSESTSGPDPTHE